MHSYSKFLLNRELFEDLKSYLEDKRAGVRDALIVSLIGAQRVHPPILASQLKAETLEDALKIFNTSLESLHYKDLSHFDEEKAIARFSITLANYVEILEGMCKELFEQLKGIPVDLWDQDLYDRLESTKVYLWDKLKESEKFILGLLVSFKKLVLKSQDGKSLSFLRKLPVRLGNAIDLNLLKQIKSAELFLHDQFNLFSKQYIQLVQTKRRCESEYYKFQGFTLLNQMEMDEQTFFRRLFLALKIWKSSEGEIFKSKVEETLKNIFPAGKTALFFRKYIELIKGSLFELAKKSRRSIEHDIKSKIAADRIELNNLHHVISDYRRYQLEQEGSLKRKLWNCLNLKKWSLAAESRRTKELLELAWEVDKSDRWFLEILEASENKEGMEIQGKDMFLTIHFTLINKILKDMSQPLISKEVMQSKAEALIKQISNINELTAPYEEVPGLILETLLRAFKYDIKHHVLTETKGFWQLWEIHHGLLPAKRSQPHQRRMKLYKSCTKHILHWIEEHTLVVRQEMAEHEIHDVQEALQEFYREVQNEATVEGIQEFKKELLEERVFFSRLFSSLKRHQSEGRHLKEEFNFVDKYFDAIDLRLSVPEEIY